MLLDLRSPTVRKLAKYSGASVVAVCVGQPVFWICNGLLGWDAVVSNLVSVSAGAIPNYTINRRWTWSQSGKNRLWGEVVPFWAMSALGVVFSLLAVHYADQRWHSTAINAMAQLFGFGVLWLAKFFVLDKLMWRIVHDLQPDVAIDEAEAGLVGALDLDGTDGEPALPHGNGTHGAGTNGTEPQVVAGDAVSEDAEDVPEETRRT
jgi:putative flippase GtrA